MRSVPQTISPGIGTVAMIMAMVLLLGVPSVSARPLRPSPEFLRLSVPPGEPVTITARPSAAGLNRTRACGTAAVSPAEAQGVRATLGRWADENAAGPAGGVIRVAFHVITAKGEGEVTDARLAEQIRELNRGFDGSGYRFELARVDRTDEPGWFKMTPGSGPERKAKQRLAVEPARHLNIYVCSPAQGWSGWASHPWASPESHFIQGVVLDHAALPGGSAPRDPSRTATHQVGHYLGLLDSEDTGVASFGFNAGQIERMGAAVPIYRPSLFSAPASRDVAKPEISPTAGAEPEDGRVLSYRGAFPNPFRAETTLRFTLPSSQPVSLRIYSVAGQLVRTLVDAPLPPGDHSAMFRADELPSGAYFAVLRVGSVQMSRTLMLVR